MTIYSIYGLIDPTTKELRYVGCSTSPTARFNQHLTYGRRHILKMCTAEWIADLLTKGLRPELLILEEYETEWKSDAGDVEKQWMHHYIDNGAQLLNRHMRKPYRKSSRVLPGREPAYAWSKERGWYYTDDY